MEINNNYLQLPVVLVRNNNNNNNVESAKKKKKELYNPPKRIKGCTHWKLGCQFEGTEQELNTHLYGNNNKCVYEQIKTFINNTNNRMNKLEKSVNTIEHSISNINNKLDMTLYYLAYSNNDKIVPISNNNNTTDNSTNLTITSHTNNENQPIFFQNINNNATCTNNTIENAVINNDSSSFSLHHLINTSNINDMIHHSNVQHNLTPLMKPIPFNTSINNVPLLLDQQNSSYMNENDINVNIENKRQSILQHKQFIASGINFISEHDLKESPIRALQSSSGFLFLGAGSFYSGTFTNSLNDITSFDDNQNAQSVINFTNILPEPTFAISSNSDFIVTGHFGKFIIWNLNNINNNNINNNNIFKYGPNSCQIRVLTITNTDWSNYYHKSLLFTVLDSALIHCWQITNNENTVMNDFSSLSLNTEIGIKIINVLSCDDKVSQLFIDYNFLYSSQLNDAVKLWDLNCSSNTFLTCIRSVLIFPAPFFKPLEFSKYITGLIQIGNYVYVSIFEGTIYAFSTSNTDEANNAPIKINGHGTGITGLFKDGNENLVVTYANGSFKIWNDKFQCISTVTNDRQSQSPIRSFCAINNILITGHQDGFITIYGII